MVFIDWILLDSALRKTLNFKQGSISGKAALFGTRSGSFIEGKYGYGVYTDHLEPNFVQLCDSTVLL